MTLITGVVLVCAWFYFTIGAGVASVEIAKMGKEDDIILGIFVTLCWPAIVGMKLAG